MPKMLIIEATIVNYGDDRGGVHAAAADVVDVTKDTAARLVNAGRALYTNKADDPSKGNLNTASERMQEAATRARAQRDAAAKAAKTADKTAKAEGGA